MIPRAEQEGKCRRLGHPSLRSGEKQNHTKPGDVSASRAQQNSALFHQRLSYIGEDKEVTEMKHTMEGFKSRLNEVEEMVNEIEIREHE